MASKCSTIPGKSSWPGLVGKNGDFAVMVIELDNPNVASVQIVPADAPVGPDVDCSRVKVKVDKKGIVVEAPTIG